MRLFVAVPLEEQAVEQVGEVQRRLRARAERAGWKASWPRPEGMHLTLKCLDGVEAERVDGVAEALAPLSAHAPFEMGLRSVGAFGGPKRPRVLWLGVDEGAEQLRALAEDVERALEPLGFAREKRGFRAHLTLARVKAVGRSGGAAGEVLEPSREAEAGRSHVGEIVLYRSHLHPSGAKYERLHAVPLRG